MPFNGTSGVQCRPMPRAFARRSPSICARSCRSRIRLKAKWLPRRNSPLFENLAGSEETRDWIRQEAAGYGQCLLRVTSRHDAILEPWLLCPNKRTSSDAPGMSALCQFVPKPDQVHRNKEYRYSITSSARASSLSGNERPSVFAVLRLITNWNFIDCTTGRSAGFSPLSTRPVYTPTSRYASEASTP
jgi:hypothetical protein